MAIKGQGEFYKCDGTGDIELIQQYWPWDPEWTHIIPGKFGGSGDFDLLFYSSSKKKVKIFTCSLQGKMTKIYEEVHTKEESWEKIIPGNFTDGPYTDLLIYYQKNSKGYAKFFKFDESKKFQLIKQHDTWKPFWNIIVPGHFSDSKYTDLLFYSYEMEKGYGYFKATDGKGGIERIKEYENWSNKWDIIVPGNFGGDSYTDLLFYEEKENEGLAKFYKTNGRGTLTQLGKDLTWNTWDFIIPGKFSNNLYTDLCFYSRQRGQVKFCKTTGNGYIDLMKEHLLADQLKNEVLLPMLG